MLTAEPNRSSKAGLVFQGSLLDDDPEWDAFLESIDEGRHEQSSLWSRVKSAEGWQFARMVVRWDGKIVAGFQALWRRGPLGRRMGYVSFGPVAADGASNVGPALVDELLRQACSLKLDLLLVQPPPESESVVTALRMRGYMPNRIYRYAKATAVLDLRQSEDALLGAMRSKTRQNIRKAMKRELTFAESGEQDLATFFSLMEMTCRRQAQRPNPESMEKLANIWRLYHPSGKMRLFTVKAGEEVVCAQLLLVFGKRASLWKIGWSGRHAESKPNDRLHWGMIRWAKDNGCRLFDFSAIDPDVVAAAQAESALTQAMIKTPSFFKLGYGVSMVAFPESLIYVRNGFLRNVYRFVHPWLG